VEMEGAEMVIYRTVGVEILNYFMNRVCRIEPPFNRLITLLLDTCQQLFWTMDA